jgi:uncharacterized protein with HEPN domain
MARSNEAWVQDIVTAIADIRADTVRMDFTSFAANPAVVRSVLYSIAVMGEAAKNISPAFKAAPAPLLEPETGSSTSISAPIPAASGTS